MKIINAVGAHLPGVVIGLAQQKAVALRRSVSLRPYKKIFTYTTDATQDLFIIIIQIGTAPAGDRVVIVNGNEFRIISAVNEVSGDSVRPIVTWKGGTPPFIVELQFNNPAMGGFLDSDTTGMVVNINSNLIDGVGYIVTNAMAREYIITKIDDADGWWADDLQTTDLGMDEQVNTQRRQNAIGLTITDSSTPPRVLYAPFSPDPIYEADGITPSGLFAKYPTGHYGPPTWCIPILHWTRPAAIVYGTGLQVGIHLAAITHVPATTDMLPGTYSYWLDLDHTIPAEGSVPDASPALPLYATFQANDELHYHMAIAEQSITINRAQQGLTNLTAWHDSKSVIYWGSALEHISNIRPGETATVVAYIANSNFNSGNMIQFSPSSSICSIGASYRVGSAHKATITFNQAGAFSITASLAGNNNFDGAAPLSSSYVYKVGFGMNTPGGVSFDINDGPITYGEALDVLCWSPISGDTAYQTPGEPAGWIVDPVPGTYLETNTDGSPYAYSITAVFYPLDTTNYPASMEYEQWLTVNKNIPVAVWSTPGSFVYGMKWLDIMNALFYNSHHVGVFGWAVEGNSLYEVSGHSKSQWNGIISDSLAMPDVDSGIFVSCQFAPTGTEAHNYETPPPTDPLNYGFSITKKTLTVTANSASKTYNGSAWSGGNGVTYSGFVQGQNQSVLSGLLSFTGAAQGAINAGTYVNGIMPGGLTSDNYAITFVPGSLTVYKATPDIYFSLPEFIVEGQSLSAYKATSSISGLTFTYHKDSSAGSLVDMDAPQVFNTGLAIYAVSDSTQNYNPASTWDGVVVKGVPIITWPDPAAITYGTALSGIQLNATASVPGTFVYSPSAGTVPGVNSGLVLSVTFYPGDSAHYTNASDWAGIVINKAVATVPNNSPPAITYGANLSSTYAWLRNNNSHGTFVFDIPESTIPNTNTNYAIGYVFTPNDNANYLPLDDGCWLTVNKAPQIVAFVLNDTDIYVGQTAYMSLTAVNQAAGAGSVTYSSGNPAVARVSSNSVYGASAGAVYITVVQAATANFLQGSFSVFLNVHEAVSFWTKTLDDCPGQSLPAGFYVYNLDGPSGGNYYTGNAILIAYTGTYPNRTRWTFIWSDLFCDVGYEERNGYTNFVDTGACDGTAVDYSLAQIEAAGGNGGIPGSPGISRWLFTETGILQIEYCRNLTNTARYFLVRKETESIA